MKVVEEKSETDGVITLTVMRGESDQDLVSVRSAAELLGRHLLKGKAYIGVGDWILKLDVYMGDDKNEN